MTERAAEALANAEFEVVVNAFSCALRFELVVRRRLASFKMRDDSSDRMFTTLVGKSLDARLMSASKESRAARRLFAVAIVAEALMGMVEAKELMADTVIAVALATRLFTVLCSEESWA